MKAWSKEFERFACDPDNDPKSLGCDIRERALGIGLGMGLGLPFMGIRRGALSGVFDNTFDATFA